MKDKIFKKGDYLIYRSLQSGEFKCIYNGTTEKGHHLIFREDKNWFKDDIIFEIDRLRFDVEYYREYYINEILNEKKIL